MKNKKEKKSSIKDLLSESQYKAFIKLVAYFFFFLIFIIIVLVANGMNNKLPRYQSQKAIPEETQESLSIKQNKLLENNHNINYIIKTQDSEYIINGTIKDNVLEGYLENDSNIRKIKLKDNILYEILNGEEIVLENLFNVNLLNVNYIMSLTDTNRAFINTSGEIKTYEYGLYLDDMDCFMTVYTNETSITSIKISHNGILYTLNFDK